MVKQLFIPLAAVAAFIILVGLFTKNQSSINWSKYFPNMVTATTAPAQQKTVTVNSKTINVELANTEALREKGLGGRSSLDAGSGMLFVFDPKQVKPIFWMKDMQISLDLIWISGNKIVKIDKNVPAPVTGTPDSKLNKYSPNQPVDDVLEVNGGYCDTNNIKVGDSVDLSKI